MTAEASTSREGRGRADTQSLTALADVEMQTQNLSWCSLALLLVALWGRWKPCFCEVWGRRLKFGWMRP